MNYFFKFLLPQLLGYFEGNKNVVKEFMPKIIEEKQEKKVKLTKKIKSVKIRNQSLEIVATKLRII